MNSIVLKAPGCTLCRFGERLINEFNLQHSTQLKLDFESRSQGLRLEFPGEASGHYFYSSQHQELIVSLQGWDVLSESQKQMARDKLDSWIPFARLKPEKRAFFEWLDQELLELMRLRKLQGGQDTWTGFYLVAGQKLELGPFRGFQTEHHIIDIHRGLCGQAVRDQRTINAGDVTQAGDYLACSPLTRSELVVPLRLSKGQIWGEIDLDSAIVHHYSARDEAFFETWAEGLAKRMEPFADELFSVQI